MASPTSSETFTTEQAAAPEASQVQEMFLLKSLLLLGLLFVPFVACLLPVFLRRLLVHGDPESAAQPHRSHSCVVSLLSCFGGGVFLATCLLELLPGAQETVAQSLEAVAWHRTSVPVAELCVALGFFLVLCLEQFSHWLHERKAAARVDDIALSEKAATPAVAEIDNSHEQGETSPDWFLVAVLSLHALFEGPALSTQASPAAALKVFAALCVHKSLLGASLSLRLVQSRMRPLFIVLSCAIFCAMAPLGGFIALELLDVIEGSISQMVGGALQGIAAGTFLYVTTFEILPHELNQAAYRVGKLSMLAAGFAVIAVFISLFD